MRNRMLIYIAQTLSVVFQPFYMPVGAFLGIFMFSYLRNLPLYYKVLLIGIIYLFTVFIPRVSIYLYRRLNGWRPIHLSQRINRFGAYALSIASYTCLLWLLYRIHMPRFAMSVIVAALVLQIICALINTRIKISTHAAAAGSLTGALIAFALIFRFNLVPWLCLSILLCGLVGTARLILRQHRLIDIWLGLLVGFLCGFICIILI